VAKRRKEKTSKICERIILKRISEMGLCIMDRIDMVQDVNKRGVFVESVKNLQLRK
jgi:hypothetical protein